MNFLAAFNNLYTLIEVGGGFIIPLIIASLVTLNIFLVQWWYSILSARRMRRLILEPTHWHRIRGMDMISRMTRSLSHNMHATEERQKHDMEMIYNHFERQIHWLSTLAALAPMLGLLGTVSGMVRIFGKVSETEIKDPLAALSGGISEALYATGGGLVVAIVAALGYHYLNARHESLGEEMARWYATHRRELRSKS